MVWYADIAHAGAKVAFLMLTETDTNSLSFQRDYAHAHQVAVVVLKSMQPKS